VLIVVNGFDKSASDMFPDQGIDPDLWKQLLWAFGGGCGFGQAVRVNGGAMRGYVRTQDHRQIGVRSRRFTQDQRVDTNLMFPLRVPRLAERWSGRRESNSHGRRFRALKTSGLVRQRILSVIGV
jgi:hypothetical protein